MGPTSLGWRNEGESGFEGCNYTYSTKSAVDHYYCLELTDDIASHESHINRGLIRRNVTRATHLSYGMILLSETSGVLNDVRVLLWFR